MSRHDGVAASPAQGCSCQSSSSLATLWNPLNDCLGVTTGTSAPKSVSGKRKTNCTIVGFWTLLHASTVAELETQMLVKGPSSQKAG